MSDELPASSVAHPAPERNETNEGTLWLSVIGPPLAWVAHLLANYAIAGQNCIAHAGSDARGVVTTMLLIDAAGIILAAIAGYVALKHWRETQSEKGGGAHHLVQSGEGRTRFLAMCGMLTSALFALAIAVDAIGTLVGPPC